RGGRGNRRHGEGPRARGCGRGGRAARAGRGTEVDRLSTGTGLSIRPTTKRTRTWRAPGTRRSTATTAGAATKACAGRRLTYRSPIPGPQSARGAGSSGGTGTEIEGASAPPSTSKTLPVTQEAASDTRYSTAQAM